MVGDFPIGEPHATCCDRQFNDMINVKEELTWKDEGFPILDSKLILATKMLQSNPVVPIKKAYDIKMVDCRDYIQVYIYEKRRIKKNENKDTSELELKKYKMDKLLDEEYEKKPKEKQKLSNEIDIKNIMRSKLQCQRIAKSNINDWKTFITLTFEENITDVEFANKRFKYFIDKVRRVKKDFKYLCITEFQKRGATHYHLLTNIDIHDEKVIYSQEDNPKFKHVKYWIDGFTSVEVMKGDYKKIIGYISKYMTKDIDNRLFNHRRYFYSRNLNLPSNSYIDLKNDKEKEFYEKKIQDKKVVYQNNYINAYDHTDVTFLELSKIQFDCTINQEKKKEVKYEQI